MGKVFNPEDDDAPYFRSVVRPETYLAFSPKFSDAHVPGRHLNALLTARDVLKIDVPEDVIATHARHAFRSFSGAVALPLNRDKVDGTFCRFLPHNVREGLHALYALARYDASDRARALAEASIEAINDYWDPELGWDTNRLGKLGVEVVEMGGGTFITGLARAIGPLVKYYQATGSQSARKLAQALGDKASAEYFGQTGEFDPAQFGTHTHSVTCVLSSLAQLADATHDESLMARVGAFYDHGLKDISDAIGWSIENCGPTANSDRGEANNTGDIIETALILGSWGSARHYQDAERMLRSHLLPSQLRDVSFIQDHPNPEGCDGMTDLADRHLGAFGFPAPYGHEPLGVAEVNFNMDIVGGAVASLCEAYRHCVQHAADGLRVNLLFDYEDDRVRVEAPYRDGKLRVQTKHPGNVAVRIPTWVNQNELKVSPASTSGQLQNGYWVASDLGMETTIFEFPLPQHEINLDHRERSIRTRFRGDQVIAMENVGADLTFFEPL